MSLEYKVHLKAFEGPLDLLLHLIEKNKIDIYDIPVAVLTEQYLTYLNQFREFNIEIASEFLLMAAELLQIKSRIMLPERQHEAEDQQEDDPRQELVERLLEYRRFKEISNVLDEMAAVQEKIFYRESSLGPVRYLPPQNLDMKMLWQAFQNVMEGQLANEPIKKVTRDKFSVQDKMLIILKLLKDKEQNTLPFTEAFSDDSNRMEMIVTFLAMLELIKLQRISIKQNYSFSPIYIFLRNDEENVL
ncbi:segregation and condensation protein A [Pectinatus cerevisiiphilus]|uniref:Segregation and condensation protein A n=1 Tax=Pectinatus cerevisiiphilus TaxID=86956 RepID=A0A4R3K8F0_9FIRM|nr:segregation/condensation protein A [Pectinatus cerevisiiphilus]TCS79274.1 condensin subunit ScpA [Pectinatus cerevisiiphilus]